MKVVKRISTGQIVYKSNPEFKNGEGLKNAIVLGYDKSDLMEENITNSQYDEIMEDDLQKQSNEKKIKSEEFSASRKQAIDKLKASGDLPNDYE